MRTCLHRIVTVNVETQSLSPRLKTVRVILTTLQNMSEKKEVLVALLFLFLFLLFLVLINFQLCFVKLAFLCRISVIL